MSVQSIPNEKQAATDVSKELAQEGNHLFLPNGAIGMQMQIPRQTAALR